MGDRHGNWSRREFLGRLTLATTTALLGAQAEPGAAEGPPETVRIRLPRTPSLCQAPLWIAEAALQTEGFTDVQFLPMDGGILARKLAGGEVDMGMNFVAPTLIRIDAGDPVVIVGGGHVGCFELFVSEEIRAIRDLKGKRVAIRNVGSVEHAFLSSMLAHVGLDPRKDVTWVLQPPRDSVRLLTESKVDAFMAFPPHAQELRATKVGKVIANSALDRPWSQYFCCMVTGSAEFVRKNPIATKRVLRALLKSAEMCAAEPDRVTRSIVDRGFTPRYDYALQAIRALPYGKWREYDPEDTVRFYSLRLHEAGMIKSTPQRIIARGTDWRFLNDLKKELKG